MSGLYRAKFSVSLTKTAPNMESTIREFRDKKAWLEEELMRQYPDCKVELLVEPACATPKDVVYPVSEG